MRVPNPDMPNCGLAHESVVVPWRKHVRRKAKLLHRQCQETLVAWKVLIHADGSEIADDALSCATLTPIHMQASAHYSASSEAMMATLRLNQTTGFSSSISTAV